jgi:putative glutamine amidotransferase
MPIIGLTTYRSENKAGNPILAITEAYTQALSAVGAAPLLIPNGLTSEQLAQVVERLDGVLFSGGGDIHPRFYGAREDSHLGLVDEDRDQVEIDLLRQVMGRGLPFLGVCRGFQLVNVALGGSLYTDIQAQAPGAGQHDFHKDRRRDYLAHPVQVTAESRLGTLLAAEQVQVNSLHHQGVRDLAPGLRPTAYAPDGILEAFELPDYPFGLAVQWHPECLQAHPPMQRLFRAFVEAGAAARPR